MFVNGLEVEYSYSTTLASWFKVKSANCKIYFKLSKSAYTIQYGMYGHHGALISGRVAKNFNLVPNYEWPDTANPNSYNAWRTEPTASWPLAKVEIIPYMTENFVKELRIFSLEKMMENEDGTIKRCNGKKGKLQKMLDAI